MSRKSNYDYDLFFSFHEDTKKEVLELEKRLKESSFKIVSVCSNDVDDRSITIDELVKNITRSKLFISFLNKNYKDSSSCKQMLNYANGINKRIILICIDDIIYDSISDKITGRRKVPCYLRQDDWFYDKQNEIQDVIELELEVNMISFINPSPG